MGKGPRPALISKGLRLRGRQQGIAGVIGPRPALISKGLRQQRSIAFWRMMSSKTSPDFKGIKTEISPYAIWVWGPRPALISKGLRRSGTGDLRSAAVQDQP